MSLTQTCGSARVIEQWREEKRRETPHSCFFNSWIICRPRFVKRLKFQPHLKWRNSNPRSSCLHTSVPQSLTVLLTLSLHSSLYPSIPPHRCPLSSQVIDWKTHPNKTCLRVSSSMQRSSDFPSTLPEWAVVTSRLHQTSLSLRKRAAVYIHKHRTENSNTPS